AGREISVMICGDEVTVQDNALNYGHDVEFESEFELYESESVAQCGLEDFESLLIQWQDLLTGY
ncbi:MAG: YacL family protein, partial [Vibrio fluvialis]